MPWVNAHLVEVNLAPAQSITLAESEACKNHIMHTGQHAYSCESHPEVCSHTLVEWSKIPSLADALEELLGKDGLKYFKSSIANNLTAHDKAATQLFDSWINWFFEKNFVFPGVRPGMTAREGGNATRAVADRRFGTALAYLKETSDYIAVSLH